MMNKLVFFFVVFALLGCSEESGFSYEYHDGRSVADFESKFRGGVFRQDLARIFKVGWRDVEVGISVGSVVGLFGEADIHVISKYKAGGGEFDSVVLFYAVEVGGDEYEVEEEKWVRFHFDAEGRLFWGVPENMGLPVVGEKDLSRGMYWSYR